MKSKTLLVALPQAPANQPYSSLPSLTGFLRIHGYQVEQRDINIEVYNALLTPRSLQEAAVIVEQRLSELRRKSFVSETENNEYKALLRAQISASYTIEHVEEAKQTKRDSLQYYDMKLCSWAHHTLLRSLELLSAAYYPSRWTLDSLKIGSFIQQPSSTLACLLKSVWNEKENIFLCYLRNEVLPSIIKASPRLLGISITYPTQVIASLTLASLIKSANPAIHICIGGACVNQDRMWTRPELYTFIDSVVLGEGEHALLSLIRKLEGQDEDWSDVPHLMYLRDGEVQKSGVTYLEDVNSLPTPDWSDLPLNLYLSPEFVPLLPTARGCYWGRCGFCTVSWSTTRKYRPRKVDLIVEDMRVLNKRYGATRFFLSSDAESPGQMKALAAAIKVHHLPFIWECETRFSPLLTQETCQHIFEGGCRYLIFGMESASQRVLDWMDKGTQEADLGKVVRNCAEVGIGVNLQTFFGFPTEIEEEACMTTDFILTHQDYIDSVALGQFVLQPGSKVDLQPGRYGVTVIKREEHEQADIVLGYNYETDRGMTQSKVVEVLQRQIFRLEKHISAAPFALSFLDAFLYVVHYGVRSVKKQKKECRMKLETLMNAKPKVSAWMRRQEVHQDSDNQTSLLLFSPSSGELLTLDAREAQLIMLCDGVRSVEQIATEYASTDYSPAAFIIIYAQALRCLKRLCENGTLIIE
jgi:anaerobic magnesium-protoporphyrin IX monomethyl ester cyclase